MGALNPRLLAELKKWVPNVCEDRIVELAPSNLDLYEPQKHIKSITVVFEDSVCVYTEGGDLEQSVALEEIKCLKLVSGVGCIFVEYIKKNSEEPILLARADSSYQAPMRQFIKRVNYFLKSGNRNFSEVLGDVGRVCEQCGRPFPKGNKTCPHCTSKTKALLRLLGLAKKEWKLIVFSMSLFLFSTAINVLLPYINRVLVDDYIQNEIGNVLLSGFLGVIFSLLAVNILRRVIVIGRRYTLAIAGNNLVVRLRDMVFCKIQELSIAKISKRTSGELLRRVNQDTVTIKQFLINQAPNLLEQVFLLIGISIILFVYDPRLALLILLPAPLVSLSYRLFWRFVRDLYNRFWEQNSRSAAVLHDIFSGIRVVKAYGTEEKEEARYVNTSERERDSQLRAERFWSTINPLLSFFMGFGEFVLLYYVGNKMLGGEMTAGEMSQFSSYAGMIYAPLSALMTFPRQLMHMMTSLTRVYEIMDENVEIEHQNHNRNESIKGYIDIEKVSFCYEEGESVLQDIDLHIAPGEFIGIVGKSGVGKSTLINLIMRMYDVDEGSIKIDGVDIREISHETLRAGMGVVLQETFLFAGSIWQNLTYAKPNATRDEVIQAAKMAGAHEFIVRLPDGYNTYVGEKGYKLSGGERQRVAIARALLHNPKILILDEATSALDTETEKLIQDALQALSSGRTTIAIAHRLSTLRNATRLVVLDQKGIAELGSHEELMEKQGIYYGLVMAQREMTKMEPS